MILLTKAMYIGDVKWAPDVQRQVKVVEEINNLLPLSKMVMEQSNSTFTFIEGEAFKGYAAAAARTSSGINMLINYGNILNVAAGIVSPVSDPEKFNKAVDSILASSIVHEEVHMEQIRSGRLIHTSEYGFVEFDGVTHMPRITGVDYFNSPWEQEAFLAQSQWMALHFPKSYDVDTWMDMLSAEVIPQKNVILGC